VFLLPERFSFIFLSEGWLGFFLPFFPGLGSGKLTWGLELPSEAVTTLLLGFVFKK
jgi:hypothetical protein